MSDNQFNFGPTVISNSLNDSSTTKALSAAKGKELSESIIKPITIDLDTVTNTSGSYTHTTTIATTGLITEGMKCIGLEVGNPAAFGDMPTITAGNDEITLSCSSVSGTSTVKVTMMRTTQATSSGIMPTAVTSEEFDILADRIGDIDDLTTTAKTDVVAAVNSLKTATDGHGSQITTLNTAIGTKVTYDLSDKAYQSGSLNNLPHGVWRIYSTATDKPISDNGYCSCIVRDSDNIYQTFVATGNKVYVRLKSAGSWGSWQQLALNDSVTALNTQISKIGTSAVELWNGNLMLNDEVTLSESMSNFNFILLHFLTNSEHSYQLVPSSTFVGGEVISQTIMANSSSGQVSYPLSYNASVQVKATSATKVKCISSNYNNVNYIVKLRNVFGVMRIS